MHVSIVNPLCMKIILNYMTYIYILKPAIEDQLSGMAI